ncbi:bacteriocin [Solimonas sp. K1W22B-7]|uniref:bacteriocin n=1 Tax=Solimonas sp. K1W22B-7 TaxID=2303331 RepID=UPI000E332CEB|nr:bacteriocin [Solimonas sp. K1W22B-7]AXQ30436.1 bacteriocin [Solimonas sp. K1W22B-7]
MSGLLGTAMAAKQEATGLWGEAAGREHTLNSARDAFKLAEEQQSAQLAGTGAGVGAMIGASYGAAAGPVGALIGAGIGLLAGELF